MRSWGPTEKEFCYILNAISDAVLAVDANGTTMYLNEADTKLKGLGEEAIGEIFYNFRSGKHVMEVLDTGRPIINVLRNKGRMDYVNNFYPIFADHKIIGVVSVAKDITQVQQLTQRVLRLENTVKQKDRAKYTFEDIIGNAPNFLSIINMAKIVALGESNVLIMGESGTGKEYIAHAIHNASKKKEGPFIAVNCTAIPNELLESELFGYEQGAFTNASKRGKLGIFEIAHTGTIFLDEIGDMNLSLQSKILRVLQDKKIRKVGGTEEVEVDVRILAATNKNIEQMILEGNFREDLFYRLSVVPLKLIPLRDRVEDIPPLVNEFIRKHSKNTEVTISQEALYALINYNWPGNIRELENAIEFAINFIEGNTIQLANLPSKVTKNISGDILNLSLKKVVSEAERKTIIHALKVFGCSVEGKKLASQALCISLAALYKKIKDYQIQI